MDFGILISAFFMIFLKICLMSIRKLAVLVFNKNIFVMEHTMVSFDELASAEKRLSLKKMFNQNC